MKIHFRSSFFLTAVVFGIAVMISGCGEQRDVPSDGGQLTLEEEDFERPETPHDIILSRVQQMVRERPEDAAKLIRTMLVEEAA